jgi:hypothetical protein
VHSRCVEGGGGGAAGVVGWVGRTAGEVPLGGKLDGFCCHGCVDTPRGLGKFGW